MLHRLAFSSVALKQIQRLDPPVRDRIERALAVIADDPQSGKPLRGPLAGKFSHRVGDWRIIYQVEGADVYVAAVAHRSSVYR
jgi:mRNA interferase RelE/StbE